MSQFRGAFQRFAILSVCIRVHLWFHFSVFLGYRFGWANGDVEELDLLRKSHTGQNYLTKSIVRNRPH